MTTQIIATGSYLPERVVSNHDLAQMMTTSDAWIREKTGIVERRYAAPGEGVSDMALVACQRALAQAQMAPENIDAILFATATPEFHAPGSGVLLQHKLGCREIPAFDVRNTSPGFLFALDLASGLIQGRRYNTILVVAAEVHSTGLDFSDRGRLMAVLFGDGAGCVLLKASDGKSGIKDMLLRTDGRYFNKLWCEGLFPQMDARHVFVHAVDSMTSVVLELLRRNNLTTADIDWFCSHQANLRIIEAVGKKLNLDPKRVPTNIERFGNTSSASIPILFDELTRQEKIKKGQRLVFASFGSGYCWGAALYQA